MTNIIKYMINDKSKYFELHSPYSRLLAYIVWDRPTINSINEKINYGIKYHFIGHTPSDNANYLKYFNILNRLNLEDIEYTIIDVDLNTFNNETIDECSWIDLSNFKSEKINIIKNKYDSDSESEEYELSDSDDLELFDNIIIKQINLNDNVKLPFKHFDLRIERNYVKYPENILNEDTKELIRKGVEIYKTVIGI